MSFELLMIACALFWVSFSICRLNDRLEIIAEILLDNSDDEDDEEEDN